MQFLRDVNINFIGNRKAGAIVSAILIITGVVFLFLRGGPNQGIDFKGGAAIRIKFESPIEVGAIRNVLSDIGLGNSEIKEIGEENEFLIRIEQQQNIGDVSELVTAELSDPEGARSGLFGLQVHAGLPQEASFRNLCIKELKL